MGLSMADEGTASSIGPFVCENGITLTGDRENYASVEVDEVRMVAG